MRRYHKKILLLKYFKIFLCDLVASCSKPLHTSCSQQQIVQSVLEMGRRNAQGPALQDGRGEDEIREITSGRITSFACKIWKREFQICIASRHAQVDGEHKKALKH